MAILIKHDGTIEPFNLKLLRQSRWSLMAQSRHRSEESDEYDGEVDFGTEFQSHDIELHCVTDDGLTVEQKYQKKVEISDALNKFRNGDWLIFESNPGKKIFAHFAGRVQIEEYPTWLRVNIPLRLDPFWVSVEENEAIRDSGVLTKLENIPGGNYVQYNGVTYLKLSGTTRRVMDLELSETSRWRNDPDWPTYAELTGGNWTIYKRKVETDGPFGRAYWTSTESYPGSDFAYIVDPVGVVNSMFKTTLFFTRLCHTLPEDLYAITGTGEEESPYILDVIPIVNKGTHETPVVIEVLADSGSVENPSITIGEEEIKYNGVINEKGLLKIDTEKMTVVSNVGEVLSFDGVDDYVDCGNDSSLDITGHNLTISLWVNGADFGGGISRDLITKGTTFGGSQGYSLSVFSDGRLFFEFNSGGSRVNITHSNMQRFSGKWVHIAGVYDGVTQKIFINGNEVESVNRGMQNIDSIVKSVLIGGGRNLKGSIAEVQVWNRALSQTEIQGNINRELTGNEAGLVGYWKFNEGAGLTAYDSAGANHGTIHSATWVNAPRYYFTNTLANYEGGFPKLPPGNTDVSVTADIGTPTVTFKWHDRWV